MFSVTGSRNLNAESGAMAPTTGGRQDSSNAGQVGGDRYILWIDGVGAVMLCLADRVSIGGPSFEGGMADISLMANLSRTHATMVRTREGYLLEAHAPTRVAGREVHDKTHLNDGYEIELGGRAKLSFQLPTVLSGSARLEFVSDHRPSYSVDSFVLMDDTCLLGPGPENHICCPCWPGAVLLFRRNGQLWCKSRMELFVGETHVREEAALQPNDIVTGPEFRFRLEVV